MSTPGARTLRPEDELSHYRIVSPLGAGGMGEVYLAQDRTLERNVAIKVLPADLVRSEERVRRFVLEAKSASSLSHPNIITIYEIGQEPVRTPGELPSSPVHYISMELVSGKTLTTLIHEDRTDLRTLLGYLAQAADGLAKAHAAGIVHRDLKPGNIMVSTDGFAKVLDFGLAKLTERREGSSDTSTAATLVADATAEGIVVGTAGYMSPEQVRGKSVDHRSDIFAFGCILYEAAARRRPFAAESGVETMHKILHDQPMPLEELNPKAPAELRRLVRRCLQKNPEQRLQSMKDLALELREIADEFDSLSASASSASISAASAVAAPAKRGLSPLLITAMAVVGLAVVALGWWALQRGDAAPQQSAFQNMRFSTQTSRGDVLEAALSADGRYLAYLAGRPGELGLYVRQVATGSDVEVLPAGNNRLESPAFTPDGNYVFYLLFKPETPGYRTLFQIPSLGGTPREVAFDIDSRVSFAPDGKQLAFYRYVNAPREWRLFVFDLASAQERLLASRPAGTGAFIASPSWSPDGTQIAAGASKPGARLHSNIVLFDPKSGREREFLAMSNVQLNDLAWLRDGKGLVLSRFDVTSGVHLQLVLASHPDGRIQRLTNDVHEYISLSASAGDEAIGAVRQSQLGNLWLADSSGAPARRLTNISNAENTPAGITALDDRTILFNAPRDQFVQVWSLSRDGGEARALTTGEQHCFGPIVGPHGIVYQRVDAGEIHIWLAHADGSAARQLTRGNGEVHLGPRSLSHDGKLLVLQSFIPDRLVTMSLETAQADTLPRAFRSFLGFAPDDQRLIVGRQYNDESGLSRMAWYSLAVGATSPTDSLRLPPQGNSPAVAPGGNGLLFLDGADSARNVYRQDFAGSAPVALTSFPDGRVQNYLLSPDQQKLAVVRRTGPVTEVWISDADGQNGVKSASFEPEAVFELAWLRDNQSLAILAGTRSSDAVLVRDFR